MTESAPNRIFTVEEANRLIGAMETVIAEIERLRGQLLRHDRELQILDALWGPKVLETKNPDHGEFEKHRRGVDETVRGDRGARSRRNPGPRRPFSDRRA